MITGIYTGIPVDDFETARAWYEIFFGCPPHDESAPAEASWRIEGIGWITVLADDARAGSALLTLVVDNLVHHVGIIAMRGIAPDNIDTVEQVARTATILDPAGNTITMVESLAETAGAG